MFPSSEGIFYQYEDENMVSALWPFIESRKIQLFCIDSVDSESFFCGWKNAEGKVARHVEYDRYVRDEVSLVFSLARSHSQHHLCQVVPFIRKTGSADRKIGATGVSWGGYHATNIILRYPDLFSFCISHSGVRGYLWLL